MSDTEGHASAKLEILKHYLNQHGALSAALVAFFQSALRVVFLLNGGAIIGALTAYGAKANTFPIGALKGALAFWIIGLIIAALCGGVIAWGQREFQVVAGDEFRRLALELFGVNLGSDAEASCHAFFGRTLRNTFFVLWVLSLLLFGAGAGFAIGAL